MGYHDKSYSPHLAEEPWKILGYKTLVAEQKWPQYENIYQRKCN